VAYHQGGRHQGRIEPASSAIRGSNAMAIHRRQFLHLAAGAAALPALPHIARAQTYPTRPITNRLAEQALGSLAEAFTCPVSVRRGSVCGASSGACRHYSRSDGALERHATKGLVTG